MKEPQHIDPERLAALLDGRLGAAEADAVRRQLAAADDDTLSAYADAVAVSAELAGESAPAPGPIVGVIPIASARRRRLWITSGAAAAAAAFVAVLLSRSGTTADVYQPALYASAVPSSASMLVEQPWSTTRGASDGLSERARAIRVGVLLTDLELDAIRRDTSKSHAVALATLLGADDRGGAARASLQEIVAANNIAPSAQRVHEIGQRALTLVDRPLADAGAYLEAARIAMLSGDSTFFDRVPPRALLQLKGDAGLDAPTKDALRSLEADMSRRPLDTSRLGGQLTALLQTLAQ